MNNLITPQRIIVCLLALSSATNAWAKDNRAETIAPYLDAQTMAVFHVDVSAIDTQAGYDYAIGLISQIAGPEEVSKAQTELQAIRQEVQTWINGFIAAGGKDIYLVASLADFPSFFMIAPAGEKSDDPALCDLLRKINPAGKSSGSPIYFDTFARYKNVIFAGRQTTLNRLKSQLSTSHPQLKAAFTVAGASTAQLLLIPSVDTLRVFNEMLPLLLQEIGYTTPPPDLTQCQWAAVQAKLPPQTSLHIQLRTNSATAAQNLKTLIKHLYQFIQQQPDVQKEVPEISQIMSLLVPTVKDNELALALTETQINKIALSTLFEAMLTNPRAEAKRVKCMTNLRQIGLAIMMYQADHKGSNSTDFYALKDYLGDDLALLTCPAASDTNAKSTYIYRGNDLNEKAMGREQSKTILAYEPPGNHCNNLNVLFIRNRSNTGFIMH